MQCTSCGGGLEYAGNGQYARCMNCLTLFQVQGGALTPIQVQAPGGGNNPEFNAMFAQNLGFGPPPQRPPQQQQFAPQQQCQPSYNEPQLEIRIDTSRLERRAMNEVSGMVWGWIIGGVVLLFLVVGGIGLVGYIFYVVKSTDSGSASTTTGGGGSTGAKASTWDGSSQLVCKGADKMTITGVKANIASGAAVRAEGVCELTLVNCDITAPIGIEAVASAKVKMTGGSITAKENSVVASAAAHVDFTGTKVTGTVKKSGAAQVNGAK